MNDDDTVKTQRIVVAGGRDYPHRAHVFASLDHQHELCTIVSLAHGACGWNASHSQSFPEAMRGADRWADEWARERGVPFVRYPADWTRHGRRAGFLRNAQMVEAEHALGCRVAILFPGGNGTASTRQLAADKLWFVQFSAGWVDENGPTLGTIELDLD